MSILSLDSFEDVKSALVDQNLSDQELISLIKVIQEGFTSKRQNISLYRDRSDFVSAYAAFYLPSNVKKSRYSFEKINTHIKNNAAKCERWIVADIGCGPGTLSLAFAEKFRLLGFEDKLEVILVDVSLVMLKQAKEFFKKFFPSISVQALSPEEFFQTSFSNNKTFRYSCFFGNSINEMGESEAFRYLKHFGSDDVMIIAPGDKKSFRRLMKFKEKLEEIKYHINFPCNKPLSKCPMKDNDWCHQVIRVKNDPSFERLSQKVKIDRRTLPFIFQSYSKENQSALNVNSGRVVQFLGKNKASYRWRLCVFDAGRHLLRLVTAEVLLRSIGKKELKQLERIEVGDLIQYKIEKVIDIDHFRITL